MDTPVLQQPLACAGRGTDTGSPSPALRQGSKPSAGGPLLSRHWWWDRTPPKQQPAEGRHPGGSQLPPGTHRATHGGTGIPWHCHQLPTLLLFSRCWLKLLCWCQSLACPTLSHPRDCLPRQNTGGWLEVGSPVPPILLSVWPVPTIGGGGWCAGPSRALFPPHSRHCFREHPGVHTKMGTCPVPNTQGMGNSSLPPKGLGGN